MTYTANDNCKIIAIANQKGGVGKTTTAVNVATALAAIGKEILLIDLDPQGNATTAFGIENSERVKTIYDVLVGRHNLADTIIESEIPNLDIVSASVDLSAAEIELVSVFSRESVLKKAISPIDKHYDYILIDCPPSLGLLTINALVAAHSIIIPLQCEFFALEGLSHLLNTISLVKDNLNKNLSIHGIVLTMYDKRNNLSEQVVLDVRNHLGRDVYNTIIPRNVKISEAPSHGQPAIMYDYKCKGSMAYLHLAKEILERERVAS